jgi:energy-converting hydrogenase A subunit R
MRAIYFDLEGPLSPQDNAYEVLSLAENGRRVFEVISRYDDVLTLEGRENYEPGDTLKLIVPFLVYYGISEEDIKKVSKKARVIQGARKVIAELRRQGWLVRVISTSYQQHAHSIGKRIGVSPKDIACTSLPLDEYHSFLGDTERGLIHKLERKIIEDFPRLEENKIVQILDEFFFRELPETRLGRVFREVRVIGGQRKVEALLGFSQRDGTLVKDSIAVGDSITDYKMLRAVKERGGLTVAFNGNEYCIPYADVAVASINLHPILTFAEAFRRGGRDEAKETARKLGRHNKSISWVEDAPLEEIIKIHQEYRKRVRGEAGKLG